MKKLYYSLLVLCMSFTSCVDKEKEPSPEDLLLGSWGYASIVYNGKKIKPGFSTEYHNRWIFNDDGTYTRRLSYFSEDPLSFSEGTWQVTDNFSKVILKDAQFGHEVVWNLLEVKSDLLKIRTTHTSAFNQTTTVAEFDMIHTD